MDSHLLKSTHMSRFFVFVMALMPFLATGQVKDSIRFFVDLSDCDVRVWWSEYSVTSKGKIIFLESRPIGYRKETPCVGLIEEKDTAILVNYFKNRLLNDPSNVIADAVTAVIEQRSIDKDAERFSKAILQATNKSIFSLIEKEFADSLMGNYRLRINTGTPKTEDCVLMRRPNGQIVIRTGTGQNSKNYPIKFWGEKRMEVSNLPGDGDKTMLFMIRDRGRFSSIDRKVQVLKSDKLATDGLGIK